MADDAKNAGEKLKVFISYSRRDAADFADELVAGLELVGFAPFIDRQDIKPGEPWEDRLGGLIAQSDSVVFVITPEAVKSERCTWEVNRTLELSKRLLPVVHKPVLENEIPEKLRRLQRRWIPLRAAIDWLASFNSQGERTAPDDGKAMLFTAEIWNVFCGRDIFTKFQLGSNELPWCIIEDAHPEYAISRFTRSDLLLSRFALIDLLASSAHPSDDKQMPLALIKRRSDLLGTSDDKRMLLALIKRLWVPRVSLLNLFQEKRWPVAHWLEEPQSTSSIHVADTAAPIIATQVERSSQSSENDVSTALLQRIREAVKEIRSSGNMPVRAKERNIAIQDWFRKKGHRVPGDRSIRRALEKSHGE